MSTVADAFEEVMNEIDNKSVEMSAEDYESLLKEIEAELEIRLELLEEEKA